MKRDLPSSGTVHELFLLTFGIVGLAQHKETSCLQTVKMSQEARVRDLKEVVTLCSGQCRADTHRQPVTQR